MLHHLFEFNCIFLFSFFSLLQNSAHLILNTENKNLSAIKTDRSRAPFSLSERKKTGSRHFFLVQNGCVSFRPPDPASFFSSAPREKSAVKNSPRTTRSRASERGESYEGARASVKQLSPIRRHCHAMFECSRTVENGPPVLSGLLRSSRLPG